MKEVEHTNLPIQSQEQHLDNLLIGRHKVLERLPLRFNQEHKLKLELIQDLVALLIPEALLHTEILVAHQEALPLIQDLLQTLEATQPLLGAIQHQAEAVQVIAGVQLHQEAVHHTADPLHPALEAQQQDLQADQEDNHYISTQQRERLAPFFYFL